MLFESVIFGLLPIIVGILVVAMVFGDDVAQMPAGQAHDRLRCR